MAVVVWKTPLEGTRNLVAMARFAAPISVGVQNGTPVVWWRVDPNEKQRDERLIALIMTGEIVDDLPIGPDRFIGTITLGFLVFHAFDCGTIRHLPGG